MRRTGKTSLDKKEAYEVKIKPQESDLNRLKRMSNELDLSGAIVSKEYCEPDRAIYGFMI